MPSDTGVRSSAPGKIAASIVCAGLAALSLTGTPPALAQDGGDSYIDTLVVTAGRVEESLRSVSTAVTVIPREEIERFGASDMGTLLRQYGVQLGEYATGLSVIKMRGFGSNSSPNATGDIVLLIDGHRSGNENPILMPLDNIERVEIIRGGASVQYGSDAHGGVVNLITRRGADKTRIMTQAGLGSWSRRIGKFAASGTAGKFDVAMSFGYSERDNYHFPPDSQEYYQTKEYSKTVYSANIGYNFSDDHRLGVIISGAQGLFGNSGAMNPIRQGGGWYYNGIGTNVTAAMRESVTARATRFVDLWYEGNIPEYNLGIQARYFTGKTIMEQNANRRINALLNRYDNDFQGASAIVNWNNDLLHLTGGIDYYREDYSQDNEPTFTTAYPVSSTSASEDKGIYLIAKLSLLDGDLWLNAGGRYDEYALTSTLDTNPIRNRGRKGTQRLTHFSPAAGATYSVADWFKLRVNYSQTFKVPSSRQLVNDTISVSGSTTYHSVGNPNLGPETAKSWEFGFDAERYGASLSATYFMTDFTDKIAQQPFGTETVDGITMTRRMYVNVPGITKFHGFEVFLDWNLGEAFGWGFELRPYLSAMRLLKYHTDGEPETLISNLNLNYGLVLGIPNVGLMASVDVTYYGKQFPSAASSSAARREFGKYTVVDFHLQKTVYEWEGKGKLIARADVFNLNDAFYMNTNQYVMPERNYLFTLKYEY
ncbi:MAG: TonB-dependent receptor [Deltaproteobacteria bacterium]|jgi:outer membrane receptor protein involved in Fe transport|nr:TonB-dependent receptor [Deltaproteobacteria bacterium]